MTGALLAVLSICCYQVGYVAEKSALDGLPPLGRPSWRWVRLLGGSTRWVTGFTAMLAGLALRLVALMWAPVSVVQPILAGGTVVFVAIARVVLRERLGPLERAATAAILLGVVLVGAASVTEHRSAPGDPLALVVMATVPAVLLLCLALGAGRWWRPAAATAVGLCYGLGAIGEKGVAVQLVRRGVLRGAVHSLATPHPWVFVGATGVGMVLFQLSLQRTAASLLVPASNATSSMYAVVGASAVFGDPWAPGGWRTGALLVGCALVGAGLALLLLGGRPGVEAPPRGAPPAGGGLTSGTRLPMGTSVVDAPLREHRRTFDQRARAALATSRRWQAAGLVAAGAMAVADVAEPVGWSVRGLQLAALGAVTSWAAVGARRLRRRLAR